MAKKRDTKSEERKPRESTSVSRRDFIKRGMAAGVGAAALGGCATGTGGQATHPDSITWDYEVDVLVIGSDRKSTRLNSSHIQKSRMPSSA